jgi:peptidyl-prolyl isomerase G (cyclophilin G)
MLHPQIGKHVVFGRVIRGYAETIQKIASVPTDERDRPSTPVAISHSGELVLRKPHPKLEQAAKGESLPVPPSLLNHLTGRTSLAPSEASASESESGSEREQRRGKKRSHRPRRDSRSLSPREASDSDLRKKSKRSKKESSKKSKKHKDEDEDRVPKEPRKETEEEYDARLEREENERIEAEKRRELARTAERLAAKDLNSNGGIIYKGMVCELYPSHQVSQHPTGRGRMKYIDPESQFNRRN